jgi:hypothetical protein
MSATDHGSASTYRNYKCRCPECRAAHAVYTLAAQKRRHARMLAGLANPDHGTPSTYANWSCRCPECTRAWRDYYRGLYASRRGAA